MKVRALKSLFGSYGTLRRGDEIELPNHLANELLALGYVEIATGEVSQVVTPEISNTKRPGRPRKAV